MKEETQNQEAVTHSFFWVTFGQNWMRREVPPGNIGSKHIKPDRTKEKLVAEVVLWDGNRTREFRGKGI